MDIDFKKLIKEDEKFYEFTKTVLFQTFSDINPQLIPTLYPVYQSGVSAEAAVFMLKMMIKFGGGDSDARRNSKV